MIEAFGAYRVGGRVHTVTGHKTQSISFTKDTTYEYDPNGTYYIESAYVQYFRPSNKNNLPPILLLHGGGMTGGMWETTPDGRQGWLHGLLKKGFEVHIIDNVERGRAGWAPGVWEGQPILRSLEEAWTLFRFGDKADFATRTPYPGQQFPISHLDEFAKSFSPRWTSTTQQQVLALSEALKKLGRCLLIAHSQGGEIASLAIEKAPETVDHLILIEPSGFGSGQMPTTPKYTIVYGDYLDCAPVWRDLSAKWRAFIRLIKGAGGSVEALNLTKIMPGASHMPMMDKASASYLEAIVDSLGNL